MKVYVETNPETIYSGRVKDEVKTTEIRMWFETDEEIEVLSLADHTKQVRKEVCEKIRNKCERTYTISPSNNKPKKEVLIILAEDLDQIQGETK